MKNKGRRHLTRDANCKGYLVGITRPIKSMGKSKRSKSEHNSNKKMQKAWNKRVRGYFKTSHANNIDL